MKVIDLCSGLGGFSQGFLDRGHKVIRIENNPKFKDVTNTIIADIRNIRDLHIGEPDVLLMSPPCNKFSVASLRHHWDQGIPRNDGTVYALRIVAWCLDAVDLLGPTFWVLENPRAMLRTILGKPRITTYWASWGGLYLKPTDLWGRFPPNMIWPKPQDWEKAPRGSNKGIQALDNSDIRAKIPYELSKALCVACEKEIDNGKARDRVP